jgi:hypothetical protein
MTRRITSRTTRRFVTRFRYDVYGAAAMKQPPELDESRGGFGVFSERATSPLGIDPYWRVGFDAGCREGFEGLIVQSIVDAVSRVSGDKPFGAGSLVDIGSGASPLTDAFTELARSWGMRHVVVDSREMLSHLSPDPTRFEVAGRFPDIALEVARAAPVPRVVIAYSVLQYVFREGIANSFIDRAVDLVEPGGVVILGDLPNRDQRIRQKQALGQCICSGDMDPVARPIGDEELINIYRQATSLGGQCFFLPQDGRLPLSRHRTDVMILRPRDSK